MYAYLDSGSDVIALSGAERDLLFAQGQNPAIVTLVMNAPAGLCYKGDARHDSYHRLIGGNDGSQLSHYLTIDNLEALRAARYLEIDARTGAIIEAGFEYPPASGQIFSLSDNSQRSLIAADAQRTDVAFTFPVVWNTKDDSLTISFADAAALHGFVLTAIGTVRAILDSGTAVKDAVRAAIDRAAITAVVDPR